MSKPTVSIIYGFAEGNWHSKHFRQSLIKQNFAIESDPKIADVIIAHSGGCFALPPPTIDKVIILINPVFWPGKSVTSRAVNKCWQDFIYYFKRGKIIQWFQKSFWNVGYALQDTKKAIPMALQARRQKFYLVLKGRRVIIIRNHNDTWLTPRVSKILIRHSKFDYYQLPGEHDDCWLNPLPYIKVLKSVV